MPTNRVQFLAVRDAEKLRHAKSKDLRAVLDLYRKLSHSNALLPPALAFILDREGLTESQIKDLERGLIDFPAIVAGREVFLCWEQDEDDIEYWHDLDTGYAGREKLPEA